jgi:hypothetical protein
MIFLTRIIHEETSLEWPKQPQSIFLFPLRRLTKIAIEKLIKRISAKDALACVGIERKEPATPISERIMRIDKGTTRYVGSSL